MTKFDYFFFIKNQANENRFYGIKKIHRFWSLLKKELLFALSCRLCHYWITYFHVAGNNILRNRRGMWIILNEKEILQRSLIINSHIIFGLCVV